MDSRGPSTSQVLLQSSLQGNCNNPFARFYFGFFSHLFCSPIHFNYIKVLLKNLQRPRLILGVSKLLRKKEKQYLKKTDLCFKKVLQRFLSFEHFVSTERSMTSCSVGNLKERAFWFDICLPPFICTSFILSEISILIC
jgi:hypothetical protein